MSRTVQLSLFAALPSHQLELWPSGAAPRHPQQIRRPRRTAAARQCAPGHEPLGPTAATAADLDTPADSERYAAYYLG